MVSTPAKVIRRQVRRPTRPLQVEISLQKGFLAMISEVLIDGNKLVIAALSQIDVEICCPDLAIRMIHSLASVIRRQDQAAPSQAFQIE